MDKNTIANLERSGAKVSIKKPEPNILGDAIAQQTKTIIAALESITAKAPVVTVEAPAAPNVTVESPKPVKQDIKVAAPSVAVSVPKRKLTKVTFNVTKRDQMGNMMSFDAIPEYEDG